MAKVTSIKVRIAPCSFCSKDKLTIVKAFGGEFKRVACLNLKCQAFGPVRKTDFGAIKAWKNQSITVRPYG